MHFTQRHGVLIDHTTTGQNDKDVFFEENVSENIISIIPVMTAMLNVGTRSVQYDNIQLTPGRFE